MGQVVCYNNPCRLHDTNDTCVEKMFMPRAADVIRQPVVVIWTLALLTGGAVQFVFEPSAISYIGLLRAAVLATLLVLGDLAAVRLEDGSALTPAPALLVAGLAV